MNPKFLYLLFLSIGISSYSQKNLDTLLKKYNNDDIPYISVSELKQLQSQQDILILDSREKNEFEVSHIPFAILIGYTHFSEEEFLEKSIDKNTPIVVYCTLGIRSNVVANKIHKAGYHNIKNLYGGIIEWKNKGYTIVDSTRTTTENVHTSSKQWNKWLKNGRAVYE